MTIVDEKGASRAQLLVTTDGKVGLIMSDAAKNGKSGTSLQVGPDGAPQLSMRDAAGTIRMMLILTGDGSPMLFLNDKKNVNRAGLCLDTEGLPTLRLQDEKGHTRTMLGSFTGDPTPDGKRTTFPENTLTLYGLDEKAYWKTP